MKRVRIKICGITRTEDAVVCVKYGVDALGLVFYAPSPRNIDIESAKEIIRVIPPFVSIVSLFMNPDQGFVQEVIDELYIDTLQFHGSESPEFCDQFHKPYYKAIAMGDGAPDFQALETQYKAASAFLLDSNRKGQAGGSGETFDWLNMPEGITKPLILAGGLSPDNVQSGIERLRPYAVDCSSGVESQPGIKDHEKIRQFVENVADVIATS